MSFIVKSFATKCRDWGTESSIFWALTTVLIIAEPILCANYLPDINADALLCTPSIFTSCKTKKVFLMNSNWIIQVAVLGLSTIFLFIQIIGESDYSLTLVRVEGGVNVVADGSSMSKIHPSLKQKSMSFSNKLQKRLTLQNIMDETVIKSQKFWTSLKESIIQFMSKGEHILEVICIIFGWTFIFFRPGLASLRSFRVFRILWYHESETVRNGANKFASFFFGIFGFADSGRKLISLIFKVMKFAVQSLLSIGTEMFFLTSRTRGGLLLMAVLVYMAFIVGMMLRIDMAGFDQTCGTIASCTYTMLRLTFFDGNGFDFAYNITTSSQSYAVFAVIVVYFCITSFGLINGLIGIFANTFSSASADVFEGTDDNPAEEDVIELKNAGEDDSSDDEDDDDNSDEESKFSAKAGRKLSSMSNVSGVSRQNSRVKKGFGSFGNQFKNKKIEKLAGLEVEALKVELERTKTELLEKINEINSSIKTLEVTIRFSNAHSTPHGSISVNPRFDSSANISGRKDMLPTQPGLAPSIKMRNTKSSRGMLGFGSSASTKKVDGSFNSVQSPTSPMGKDEHSRESSNNSKNVGRSSAASMDSADDSIVGRSNSKSMDSADHQNSGENSESENGGGSSGNDSEGTPRKITSNEHHNESKGKMTSVNGEEREVKIKGGKVKGDDSRTALITRQTSFNLVNQIMQKQIHTTSSVNNNGRADSGSKSTIENSNNSDTGGTSIGNGNNKSTRASSVNEDALFSINLESSTKFSSHNKKVFGDSSSNNSNGNDNFNGNNNNIRPSFTDVYHNPIEPPPALTARSNSSFVSRSSIRILPNGQFAGEGIKPSSLSSNLLARSTVGLPTDAVDREFLSISAAFGKGLESAFGGGGGGGGGGDEGLQSSRISVRSQRFARKTVSQNSFTATSNNNSNNNNNNNDNYSNNNYSSNGSP